MLISDDGVPTGAVADGTPCNEDAQPAGSFRFLLADETWEWSSEVERMHGYGPGEAAPTTELVTSHEHPDDRSPVTATLEQIVRTGKPFSARRRIIDVQGRVHDVVVVGDRLRDGEGDVVGTQGYYVDVTPSAERVTARSVDESTESHGRTDQAVGMLMLVYRINAESAIDLLKWRSQAGDVQLHAIGRQIVDDFLGLPYTDVLPPRSSYDQLLLTAHERVDPAERNPAP